jgi:hypothetical protein
VWQKSRELERRENMPMSVRRLAALASALVLAAAILAIVPGTAFAIGDGYDAWSSYDAWAGYTVPIQLVYQFPAAIVYQQGVRPPVAPPTPLYIRVDAHHVINR